MIVPIVLLASIKTLITKKCGAFFKENISVNGHSISVAYTVIKKDDEENYNRTYNVDVKAFITYSENRPCENSSRCRIHSKYGYLMPCPPNHKCENCPFPDVKEYYSTHYVSTRNISIDEHTSNEDGEEVPREFEDKSTNGDEVYKAISTDDFIVQAINNSQNRNFKIIHSLIKRGLKPYEMAKALKCSTPTAYSKVK